MQMSTKAVLVASLSTAVIGPACESSCCGGTVCAFVNDREQRKLLDRTVRTTDHRNPIFSEESCAEGGGEPSAGKPVTRFLCGIARAYTRRADEPAEDVYKASAEREQGIPDEVYTLW